MIPISLVILALSVPLSARADAVSEPPDDCPSGAIGATSHSGTWCAPTACDTAQRCEGLGGGERRTYLCRPQGLCVRRELYDPGGLRPLDVPAQQIPRDVADAPCTADTDCSAPARCEIVSRCVRPSLPELAAHQAGCSCRVAPRAPPGAALALVALQLGVLALRARRTRS